MLIQRKAVLAILPWGLVFAVALWILFPNHNPNSSPKLDIRWQQPKLLFTRYPRPISSQQWQLNFEPIEETLARIKLDSDGNLALDDTTLHNLKSIHSSTPETLTNSEQDRFSFLIMKSMPAPAGTQLAKLVESFQSYHQEEQQLEHQMGNTRALPRSKEKFKRKVALQNQHFGVLKSQALFGKQRALTEYLLKRRAIVENPSLSPQIRQSQLAGLRNSFQSLSSRDE